MKTLLAIFLSLYLLSGCDKNDVDAIDYSSFTSLSDSSLYTSLTPGEKYDYFEFRWSYCGKSGYTVMYSRGEKCSEGSDTVECLQQLDSVYSVTGFSQNCLPSCCQHYFVSKADNQIEVFNNTESVISFLKPIDTPSDALMVAFTQDYYFHENNVKAGGVKLLDEKFQIIVLKHVRFCDPVETDWYLLEINREGEIAIVKSGVYEKEYGVCI